MKNFTLKMALIGALLAPAAVSAQEAQEAYSPYGSADARWREENKDMYMPQPPKRNVPKKTEAQIQQEIADAEKFIGNLEPSIVLHENQIRSQMGSTNKAVLALNQEIERYQQNQIAELKESIEEEDKYKSAMNQLRVMTANEATLNLLMDLRSDISKSKQYLADAKTGHCMVGDVKMPPEHCIHLSLGYMQVAQKHAPNYLEQAKQETASVAEHLKTIRADLISIGALSDAVEAETKKKPAARVRVERDDQEDDEEAPNATPAENNSPVTSPFEN